MQRRTSVAEEARYGEIRKALENGRKVRSVKGDYTLVLIRGIIREKRKEIISVFQTKYWNNFFII